MNILTKTPSVRCVPAVGLRICYPQLFSGFLSRTSPSSVTFDPKLFAVSSDGHHHHQEQASGEADRLGR